MSTDASGGKAIAKRNAAQLLTTGYRRTECIAAAVGLGLFDLLHTTPATAAELATRIGANAPLLRRLLRALVAMEVLSEDEGGSFRTSELGAMFTSDELGPAVRLFVSQPQRRAWSRLEDAVRTGERAFDLEHGMGDWDFYATHPEMGAIFDAGMRALTGGSAAAIVKAHDFSAYGTVADVGGGDGTLLIAILEANPRLQGILFDRAGVVERAARRLAESNVSTRCRAIAGDFLEEVPGGADAYVMKWILHDWEDAAARRILSTCRRAMKSGADLIVVERVIPEQVGARDLETVMADLQMMVMNGGLERTETEFRELLADSGFRLVTVSPTGTPVSVFRAVAV
jgi:ubiquinone/menaquinone biosynthesis C-methylase UbiE